MSAAGSLFARLYAGHTGVDPYSTAVSDTYQDLFNEGIFTGKGLYDVDAFSAALEGTVPENALLSHDLFEGLHSRVALASDIELVDEYPSSVLSHARRQHRWIRGDWQILLWLFPIVPSRRGLTRNTLPVIARWKIFDNLRRSLVAPMLLLMLDRRVDGAPWPALVLDNDGDGRRRVPAPPRHREAARRAGTIAVCAGVPGESAAGYGDVTGPDPPEPDVPGVSRVRLGACDRHYAHPSHRDEAANARVGDGGRHLRAAGSRPDSR